MGKESMNLSLRQKLFAITVPLIIIIFVFGIMQILASYNNKNNYRQIEQLVELSVAGNNLVHELQKERGTTAGYLGSKGQNFVTELSKQHKKTDAALVNFKVKSVQVLSEQC